MSKDDWAVISGPEIFSPQLSEVVISQVPSQPEVILFLSPVALPLDHKRTR